MKYVKFAKEDQAEAYKVKLQAYHDSIHTTGPRIIDCVVAVYDNTWACTLLDTDISYPDVGDGIIVDSLEPPIISEEI